MRSRFQRCKLAVLMLLALVTLQLTGCRTADPALDGDKVLTHVIKQVHKAPSFSFQGATSIRVADVDLSKDTKFQGYVTDRGRAYLTDAQSARRSTAQGAHNPLQALQLVADQKREVTVNTRLSDNVTLVLDIQADETKSTAYWQREWRNRNRAPSVDVELSRLASVYRLSDEEQSRWRQESAVRLAEAAERFEAMLSSLRTRTEYRLSIDRGTDLPVQLDAVTVLNFVSEGEKRQESSHTTYRFFQYNQDAVIPEQPARR